MTAMEQLIKALDCLSLGRKSVIRQKNYTLPVNHNPENQLTLTSYNVSDYAYLKPGLPTMARGLFISKPDSKIIIRGYNKFFNVNQTPRNSWSYLKQHCVGPIEVSLKENGCIIYVSAFAGGLVITSKHAIGGIHAVKAREWLDIHLQKAGVKETDLISHLQSKDLTAVFELADDDFEEHILSYPKEKSGLYCHGLNENSIEFRTRPAAEIQAFGERFGFFVAESLMFDTMDQVQVFSDDCAKTGSYNGKPIEGFVVRCSLDNTPNIHFFKIKFDQPYLMFREWREVTKIIMSAKRKPRFRFSLTEKYITWVTALYKQKPALFKEYNNNKGIIRIRNMFLNDVVGVNSFDGVDLTNLCQQGLLDSTFGSDKYLIVPIATIGVGKTTLGRSLTILYPDLFGHIQNDNISAKKASAVFEQSIMDQFVHKNIVYADRNNHLFQHREGICKAFKTEYPGGTVIALDWDVDSMDPRKLIEFTCKRVEKRGENHQSLTPSGSFDYRKIISSFVYSRNPINLEHDADKMIDRVVKLSLNSGVEECVKEVCKNLKLEIDDAKISAAVASARSYQEPFKKATKGFARPSYYGVDITDDIIEVLGPIFKRSGPEAAQFWEKNLPLIQEFSGRKHGWHTTIVLRSKSDPELLKSYDERFKASTTENGVKSDDPLAIGSPVELVVSKVLWDTRVITWLVESSNPEYRSMNEHRHITIATLGKEAKPIHSNDLISCYLKNPESVNQIDAHIKLNGKFSAFFN